MYPKLTIEFSEKSTTNTKILYKTNSGQTNVSHPNYVIKAGNENINKKGFQLSATRAAVVSSLNGSYTYFGDEGYPGFLSSAITPSNASISFYIMHTPPTHLYIMFDSASGEYATAFTLKNDRTNDTVSVSNNNVLSVGVDVNSLNIASGDSVTLTVTGWSASSKSVKITNINSISYKYELYGSQLIDFKCSENFMDSQLSVSPGICEQYADITVYDKGQLLHGRAKAGALETDAKVTLSVVDNSSEKILGTYFVSDWDINSNSSNVKINCRDKSYMFSKINVARSSVMTRNVHTLLVNLFAYAANTSWEYLDVQTQARCVNMIIPDSWWLASDLQTMLNKICAVGMLRIYWYIDKFYVGRCV